MDEAGASTSSSPPSPFFAATLAAASPARRSLRFLWGAGETPAVESEFVGAGAVATAASPASSPGIFGFSLQFFFLPRVDLKE
jgi:hypothetical protein